jgi:thioredoxin 1
MKELIHFTADWCMPCKKLTPIIEKFLSENKDIEYTRIDVDIDFNIAEQYNIMSVPTLISKVDGKIYDRATGLVSEFVVKSLFG